MKNLKKSHWLLIIFSLLILAGCIGMTVCLLFSNYQNVRLFKQAQHNFNRGDSDSLSLAESQLRQLIRNDSDHEAAYIMLGTISEKRKVYPEQVYYCYMAHRLNPLSEENKERYIKSLWYARYFDRLENFLSQQHGRSREADQLLLYAAGRNGNFNKHKDLLGNLGKTTPAGALALLLFKNDRLTPDQKLAALHKMEKGAFIKQEILAAKAELYLESGDTDSAEKALKEAYGDNPYAFAPALGRFYANFRTLGAALPVFEKHLATYHDPGIALQMAEIYCLLGKTAEIAELRKQYQGDSGKNAMLLCYYFDALHLFAQGKTASLKEVLIPLRENISTPLALFLFFCVDLQEKECAKILEAYTALVSRRGYANLQSRADEMVSLFLKKSLKELRGKEVQLLALAKLLYERKKEPFTAKIILLLQKRSGSVDVTLVKDALNRFGQDQGIVKIAIEYFLKNDLVLSEKLIALYKQRFPEKTGDMLRYEIILASEKKYLNLASRLFQKNFSQDLLPDYWNFASSTMREEDLLFLGKDKLYAPFCKALLLLKKGRKAAACDLLEDADFQGNLTLLFFAARTLAENGRNQAALKKYALFPEKSPYQLDVLLNTAELLAESGNLDRALEFSGKAYQLAPGMSETQLCFADKLYRKGELAKIPDIVKLKSNSPYRTRMTSLWIAGMRQKIKECDSRNQREKTRELCRQFLSVVPGDKAALECLKKLNKMPQ